MLQQSLNKMLALDPCSQRFLKRHNGKVLQIDVTDFHLTLFFIIKHPYIRGDDFY